MANERKNEKKLEILAVLLVLQHRRYTEDSQRFTTY